MKKVVIALTATLSVFAVGIGALFLWEYRSKAQLEAQVEDYLGACDLSPTAMDVRGRPYILSAMSDRAELTYVDIAPRPGMTKDRAASRSSRTAAPSASAASSPSPTPRRMPPRSPNRTGPSRIARASTAPR
ncbi:hypothetical protein IOD13_04430 [Brevibacterium casei]|nr:hypothetical protein [Brevibacterium casei]